MNCANWVDWNGLDNWLNWVNWINWITSVITIMVLDILNILRIVPGIILNLHKYLEFQLVYCSVGVFHAVAVAILLVCVT